MADLSSMSDADLQALYGAAPTANPLAGMSDADLQALHQTALATDHPMAGPSGSIMTDAARRIGTGAANAAASYLSLPNLAAQGIDKVAGLIPGVQPFAQKALESIPSGNGSDPLFPDFQTARSMAFHTTGGTEYVPETWAGRRGQDVINGIMSASPASLAVSGPRAALASLPAVAGGSATGGAAAEAFPDHPLIASVLGSVPGMALGNAMLNAPQRVASAVASSGATSEPYGAFDRLGLPTTMSGTATGNPGLQYAEKFAARMPGSEETMANARSDLVGAWQNKLNDVASGMGSATTPQEAGTSLQSAAGNWLDQFKNEQAARWGLFKTLVPGGTPVDVPGFRSSLNSVLQDYGGADNLAKVLQPQLAASLQGALGKDLGGGSALPWQSVQSVRTALGEMLENPQPIEGISKSAVKRLYGGLSDDMQTAASQAGPYAERAFRQANAITRTGHGILDDFVGPILTADTPEQATQFAMGQARQGGTRLTGVTSNLPSAAGDLRAYALRNAATNTESPTSLATALAGRRPIYSPEAQATLFGNVQQPVADLATTGSAMQPFEKDLNNSPTATHSARGLGRLMAAGELAREGHDLAGVPGAVAGGLTGLMAPNILGRAAQATALNPYMAALYGRSIPLPAQSPSRLARALMASPTALGLPPPSVAFPQGAPATSPSSVPR